MGDTDTTNSIVNKTYTDPVTGKFVKGNPGGGRPEGSVSIVEGIKRKLMEIEPGNQKTYYEMFLSKLFQKAIRDGDVNLMRDMIDRTDGKPKQSTDLTSGGEKIETNTIVFTNFKDATKR